MTETVASTTPALDKLDELIEELQAIRATQAPLIRAELVRAIDRRARGILGRVGDEAVLLATNELIGARRRSHDDVASYLGVSRHRVSNAISDYRRWLAEGCPS